MDDIDWHQEDRALIGQLLTRWGPLLASHHIDVRIGDPVDLPHLDWTGAEAIFLPPDPVQGQHGFILLRHGPSRSALLEEVAHALQHIRKRFAAFAHRGEHVLSLHREIEVAECLTTHAERFQIPFEQYTTTTQNLATYKEKLQATEVNW